MGNVNEKIRSLDDMISEEKKIIDDLNKVNALIDECDDTSYSFKLEHLRVQRFDLEEALLRVQSDMHDRIISLIAIKEEN